MDGSLLNALMGYIGYTTTGVAFSLDVELARPPADRRGNKLKMREI